MRVMGIRHMKVEPYFGMGKMEVHRGVILFITKLLCMLPVMRLVLSAVERPLIRAFPMSMSFPAEQITDTKFSPDPYVGLKTLMRLGTTTGSP